MSSKEWINDLGSVLKDRKKPGKFYIKINKEVTLKPGDIVQMKTIQEENENMVKAGKMTEEEAEQRSNKLDFIKYNLTLPPRN